MIVPVFKHMPLRSVVAWCLVVVGSILLIFLLQIYSAPSSQALSAQIAPLRYDTTLQKGEVKKGFIDISNPSAKPVTITTSTQAFRQTDSSGSLQFYDEPAIRRGIVLDLDSFELKPRQVLRMFFTMSADKLPTGDIFAAIFFTSTSSQETTEIEPAVRVGTLLTIVNGQASKRIAEIVTISASRFQLGRTVHGDYQIKNTDDPKSGSGFFPTVVVKNWPFGTEKTITSPLVFAGNTRTSDFSLPASSLSLKRISVTYESSSQSRWVFSATPVALSLIGIVFLAATTSVIVIKKLKKRRRTL